MKRKLMALSLICSLLVAGGLVSFGQEPAQKIRLDTVTVIGSKFSGKLVRGGAILGHCDHGNGADLERR